MFNCNLYRSLFSFSLEGTPAAVDSLGIVRILNRSMNNTWSVVANTKAQVVDSTLETSVFFMQEDCRKLWVKFSDEILGDHFLGETIIR